MIWAFMGGIVRSWLEIWALPMAFGHFAAKISVSCLETVPISIEKVLSATCSLSLSLACRHSLIPLYTALKRKCQSRLVAGAHIWAGLSLAFFCSAGMDVVFPDNHRDNNLPKCIPKS